MRSQSAAIHLAAVRDSGDDDTPLRIVDRVDDAVVADAHSEVIPAGELANPGRPRILGEPVYRRPDPFARGTVKAPVSASRCRVETNLVARLSRSLLPSVCPRHGELLFVACLESREAVLEVLDAIEQLGVPIDVDEYADQVAALRDVQDLVAVSKRIELTTEPRAQVFR
jgi:hypothetical protein